MNIIAWLEFDLGCYETAGQHFCHYVTGIPQLLLWFDLVCFYGVSTIVVFLKPKSIFIRLNSYILNNTV